MGIPSIPNAARQIVKAMTPQLMRQIDTLGMTPRQQELNFFWSWYATCRYDARKVDWDGSERVDRVDAESIATAGVLPGGFYDAGQDFPLKFRRPSAPYNLARVITNRFTGLLFSESQRPRLKCVGDAATEDYVGALAKAASLWAAMSQVRTFGGATGSFCVGFKFKNGKPIVEVHDPRWVTPVFKDAETHEVESIDKRWMWPEFVLGESGEYEEVWYWSRRIVNAELDACWYKVPVDPTGREPDWVRHRPDQEVKHGFGFCPIVWGQNIPVVDAEDGEPDCLGVYDMIEEMDGLIASSGGALRKNLDPTVIIATDKQLRELRKGSDNAIKVEKGGEAKYLEGTFEGPKQALVHANVLRGYVLEVCQCVLENPNDAAAGGDKTATEARMDYASMLSRADTYREQYGQKCVLPLLTMMLAAVRKLNTSVPGAAPNGGPLRRVIVLPPREMTDDAGKKTYQPRVLPEDVGGALELSWPPYFPPSLADATSAAQAVKTALKDAEAIDLETAVRMLASYFRIDDVPGTMQKIKAESAEREKEAAARASAAFAGGGGGGF